MRKFLVMSLLLTLGMLQSSAAKKKEVKEFWPDGTEMSAWFKEVKPVDVSSLGKQYRLTDYNIFADGRVHTAEIQALIDRAAQEGGGVIVVPQGIYMTGGLIFKQGTHLLRLYRRLSFGQDANRG